MGLYVVSVISLFLTPTSVHAVCLVCYAKTGQNLIKLHNFCLTLVRSGYYSNLGNKSTPHARRTFHVLGIAMGYNAVCQRCDIPAARLHSIIIILVKGQIRLTLVVILYVHVYSFLSTTTPSLSISLTFSFLSSGGNIWIFRVGEFTLVCSRNTCACTTREKIV